MDSDLQMGFLVFLVEILNFFRLFFSLTHEKEFYRHMCITVNKVTSEKCC